MNTKKRFSFHTGTCLVLLVFVILCLVTFAVLSIVNANSDYQLSQKTAAQTTAYYKADAEAKNRLAKVANLCMEQYENAPKGDSKSYYTLCSEALEASDSYNITRDENPLLSFLVPINETQNLEVMVKLQYPDKESSPFYKVVSWQSTPSTDWIPDENESVYQRQ